MGAQAPRGMTPLEISYACLEIMGNHDRNHWKSGNQASHRNPCEILNEYKIHERNLKYIYKYHLISLIMLSTDL